MARTKLVKIYEDRNTGSLFIRSTIHKGDRFVLRNDKYGKAVSGKISNSELGKTVREIFRHCK